MSATAELIKRLRAAGFSQSEIARQCGIPQFRLSRWESGRAPVGADDALKLAAMVKDKLGSSDPSPTLTPTEDHHV